MTDEQWTRATFERVECEAGDDEQTVYLRRMGMRLYFKELKMNSKRIQAAKEAKEAELVQNKTSTSSMSTAGKPAKKGKKKAAKK